MNEELLEEARKAVHGAIPGSGDYAQWERHREAGFDMLGDIAKAVLNLAEKQQAALVACPHWAEGKITMRKGCTACEAARGHDG